ncbi:hypothetical protein NPX13_g4092 [Xylaria arbuscula]|uniref:Xylanolytic transcriptional activator regulatory domain-containing protein n=1 Tax=Xylaria arbuscula TaxID=114810 RepID=A0A9W8NH61_9PEZI|nr:hypothetical protein NPX13_g4092 [Xylaria arbuscula]
MLTALFLTWGDRVGFGDLELALVVGARKCDVQALPPRAPVVDAIISHANTPSPPIHLPSQLGDLVDTYFNRIYPLPSHAFLHPASTKERCADGTLEPVLAFAICALAMWYERPNRQGRALADSWSKEAESRILCHLGSPTTPRLQALLLIISYQMQVGSFQRAFMLIATAARYAVAMRLNYERPDLDAITQEVRRRIVWSLKIVERYFAVGLPEFEACPIDTIYLQFPGDERGFGYDTSRSDDGTYGLFVKLELIRRDIMKLTRAVALCDEPYYLLPEMIIELKRDLDKIALNLSTYDDYASPTGSDTIEHTNLSTRKIFAWISFHQAYCDLHRILLRDYPEAAPRIVLDAVDVSHIEEAERECLEHASSIIKVMTGLTYNSKSPLILEFDTAICVYHAMRLIWFIARFGRGAGRPTPEYATSRADLCLITMRQFFAHSALVQPIIDDMERLRNGDSFQQAVISGFTSPPEFREGRMGIEQHLSEAVKARQKLAVHSLLRRANFTDDNDEDRYTATPTSEEPLPLFT